MKKAKCSESNIFQILKAAESSVPVPELCRKYGMSNAAFCNWRPKYGSIQVSDAKRLKELDEENRWLKRMYAESQMDAEILRDALAGKY